MCYAVLLIVGALLIPTPTLWHYLYYTSLEDETNLIESAQQQARHYHPGTNPWVQTEELFGKSLES